MNLVMRCTIAITDSGGVQEETTYLGIPCVTLRENTERPITLTEGSNRLAKPQDLPAAAREALAGGWPQGRRPALGRPCRRARGAKPARAPLADDPVTIALQAVVYINHMILRTSIVYPISGLG